MLRVCRVGSKFIEKGHFGNSKTRQNLVSSSKSNLQQQLQPQFQQQQKRNMSLFSKLFKSNSSKTPTSVMKLIQWREGRSQRHVGVVVNDDLVYDLTTANAKYDSIWAIWNWAFARKLTIAGLLDEVTNWNDSREIDYETLLKRKNTILPAFDHPTMPNLCFVTGVEGTHSGEVGAQMVLATDQDKILYDAAKRAGKPVGMRGAQPKFFYKGNGLILRGHNWNLDIPDYALDGGEEAELFGIYIVGMDKMIHRIGFAQGNEWSDHEMEHTNDFYFQASKIRMCSLGPELVISDDNYFNDLQGQVKVFRPTDGPSASSAAAAITIPNVGSGKAGKEASAKDVVNEKLLYDSKVIVTGEKNMLYSWRALEDAALRFDHFVRIPGSVLIHAMGSSTKSWWSRRPNNNNKSNSWKYETGDRIEMGFKDMGPPLINTVNKKIPSGKAFRAVSLGVNRHIIY